MKKLRRGDFFIARHDDPMLLSKLKGQVFQVISVYDDGFLGYEYDGLIPGTGPIQYGTNAYRGFREDQIELVSLGDIFDYLPEVEICDD